MDGELLLGWFIWRSFGIGRVSYVGDDLGWVGLDLEMVRLEGSEVYDQSILSLLIYIIYMKKRLEIGGRSSSMIVTLNGKKSVILRKDHVGSTNNTEVDNESRYWTSAS
ncbi:predicted protein [Sclerotinia sclerotiorum 1980 UF-70]|uniref:Uncharacterized protein n=1 Tax=Sclerotinia sclerotiorum (strain ATCC 18683 / 1980 / Ss-1) TaxID=665079 RepID=A7E5P1_SCLS1|nr:predicted protein [Sclerotinia sclerotiorum 1980 UF-70]EDN91213.1 predicted protein [Sclerotinia sclerotiorum 1980 UF-70]